MADGVEELDHIVVTWCLGQLNALFGDKRKMLRLTPFGLFGRVET